MNTSKPSPFIENNGVRPHYSQYGRHFLKLCSLIFGLHFQMLQAIDLPQTEALSIGKKIWQNECGGTIEGLTSWNKGEAFASLGIGHFIWFPADLDAPFDESFPRLLNHLQKRGAKIPSWLLTTPDCPWRTKEEFDAARNSQRMVSLRTLLKDTIDKQAEFAAQRLAEALPKMTQNLSPQARAQVEKQFHRVATTPGGYYPLMDYVNFKGEGTKETERYQNQGWGLLQVLSNMHGTETGPAALNEFADSAILTLKRRVELSPPSRAEARWLPGWTNRCHSYRSNPPPPSP
jgi:hypothetical protein